MIQGVGAASMLVPLYTAECSPPAIRGRLVGIYEIGVQVGTCIGFWINFGVDRHMAPNTSQWMTPFAIQLVPAGLLLIGLCFLSESPRWLAKEQGRDRAAQTLAYLRGLPVEDPSIQDEMAAVLHQLHMEDLHGQGGYRRQARELTFPGTRNRLVLGVVIMIFFQMAGSNAINYYSPRIFASIGLQGSATTLFSTGIYGIVRLVAVIIAMHWVVDRLGRTRMLMCGGAVMVSPSLNYLVVTCIEPTLYIQLLMQRDRPSQCGSSALSRKSTASSKAARSAPAHTQPSFSFTSMPWHSASAGPVCPGSSVLRSIHCASEGFVWLSVWQHTGCLIL